MITPKEKAEELIEKMYYSGRYSEEENYIPTLALERAKQCALIAVDEIINNFGLSVEGKMHYCSYFTTDYYKEVKEEIEKL